MDGMARGMVIDYGEAGQDPDQSILVLAVADGFQSVWYTWYSEMGTRLDLDIDIAIVALGWVLHVWHSRRDTELQASLTLSKYVLYQAFNPPLRRVPGPFLTNLTRLPLKHATIKG